MPKDKFVVVGWPECQFFMGDRESVHLADGHSAYKEFGDSAYFVLTRHFEAATGKEIPKGEQVYVAVQFPESRLYMGAFPNAIYPINGEEGLKQYGQLACFVEEGLYNAAKTYIPGNANRPLTLMDIFLYEACTDNMDRGESSECLKEFYDGANQMQRASINHVFTIACGYSYEDLLGMESEQADKIPGDTEKGINKIIP